MKKLLAGFALFGAVALWMPHTSAQQPIPQTPDTGSHIPSVEVQKKDPHASDPAILIVPSIGLTAPIEGVGENELGEMAVPDGATGLVGWYQDGTIPGNKGSAVLAAHVYAAFKKLSALKVGSDIYIITKGNETLHFVVEESKLTNLQDVSPYFLFERSDKARLNLITCAGTFDKKLGTYTKRLIDYAVLVN